MEPSFYMEWPPLDSEDVVRHPSRNDENARPLGHRRADSAPADTKRDARYASFLLAEATNQAMLVSARSAMLSRFGPYGPPSAPATPSGASQRNPGSTTSAAVQGLSSRALPPSPPALAMRAHPVLAASPHDQGSGAVAAGGFLQVPQGKRYEPALERLVAADDPPYETGRTYFHPKIPLHFKMTSLHVELYPEYPRYMELARGVEDQLMEIFEDMDLDWQTFGFMYVDGYRDAVFLQVSVEPQHKYRVMEVDRAIRGLIQEEVGVDFPIRYFTGRDVGFSGPVTPPGSVLAHQQAVTATDAMMSSVLLGLKQYPTLHPFPLRTRDAFAVRDLTKNLATVNTFGPAVTLQDLTTKTIIPGRFVLVCHHSVSNEAVALGECPDLEIVSPDARGLRKLDEQITKKLSLLGAEITEIQGDLTKRSGIFSGLTPRELEEHGVRMKTIKVLQDNVEQLEQLRVEAATYKDRVVGHVFLSSGLLLYTEDSSIWPSEPSYRGRPCVMDIALIKLKDGVEFENVLPDDVEWQDVRPDEFVVIGAHKKLYKYADPIPLKDLQKESYVNKIGARTKATLGRLMPQKRRTKRYAISDPQKKMASSENYIVGTAQVTAGLYGDSGAAVFNDTGLVGILSAGSDSAPVTKVSVLPIDVIQHYLEQHHNIGIVSLTGPPTTEVLAPTPKPPAPSGPAKPPPPALGPGGGTVRGKGKENRRPARKGAPVDKNLTSGFGLYESTVAEEPAHSAGLPAFMRPTQASQSKAKGGAAEGSGAAE